VTAFFVGLFSIALASEAEATDIFVWIEGIKGESNVKLNGLTGWIHVESMSHHMSQSGSMHVGGGGGSGKVQVGDIMLVKNIDKATPDLNLLCANGKHKSEAVILLTRRQGQHYRTYMEYRLRPVLVSSVGVEVAKGKPGIEVVTLNFAEIRWKYFGHGTPIEKGWNIEKNVEESLGQKSSSKSSGQTKPRYIPRQDRKIPPSRTFKPRY
jgi:type VI secretion system secreted protein Hcp